MSRATNPGYWMNETSGVLRPAIEAYLNAAPMTGAQIAAIRAYLRQWITGDFKGPLIEDLRERAENIATRRDIFMWLRAAADEGIDPL